MQSGAVAASAPAAASWKALVEVTKTAWAQNEYPLAWGTEVAVCIHEESLGLPSVELAQVLCHCLLTTNGSSTSPGAMASLWSYIQHAMSVHMVSALHMLALLTARFHLLNTRILHSSMHCFWNC